MRALGPDSMATAVASIDFVTVSAVTPAEIAAFARRLPTLSGGLIEIRPSLKSYRLSYEDEDSHEVEKMLAAKVLAYSNRLQDSNNVSSHAALRTANVYESLLLKNNRKAACECVHCKTRPSMARARRDSRNLGTYETRNTGYGDPVYIVKIYHKTVQSYVDEQIMTSTLAESIRDSDVWNNIFGITFCRGTIKTHTAS